MVPGPTQHAAAVALADDTHVEEQAARYLRRLGRMREVLAAAYGIEVPLPGGGLYLWAAAPDGDAWGLVERLAADAGCLASPGEFYGPDATGYVRLAMVVPDERIELVARRLDVA